MTHWDLTPGDDRLVGAISLAAKRHMVAGTPFTLQKLPGPSMFFGQKSDETGLARTNRAGTVAEAEDFVRMDSARMNGRRGSFFYRLQLTGSSASPA